MSLLGMAVGDDPVRDAGGGGLGLPFSFQGGENRPFSFISNPEFQRLDKWRMLYGLLAGFS